MARRTPNFGLDGSAPSLVIVLKGLLRERRLGPFNIRRPTGIGHRIDPLPHSHHWPAGDISSQVRLFANHTALYLTIEGPNDSQALQKDLEKLPVWKARWDMEFSPSKCQVVWVTGSKKTIQFNYRLHNHVLGPVVQSVVSLTSSLRVISLTVLADSIHNILIFFAVKMWVAFALQKLLTFFQQKISTYLRITRCKF